jgi:hypothetical protein
MTAMTIRFLVLATLLAAPAYAQSAGELLFLSPMGEPFRGTIEAPPEAAWFDGADSNRDGRLAAVEMARDAERFFKLLDVDASGEIDPRENERYELQIAPEVSGRVATRAYDSSVEGADILKGGLQAPRTYRPGGAALFSYFGFPQPVMAADANFNRGVSAREFERAAEQRFAMLDTNGDRVVERGELPKPPRRKVRR